MRNCKNVPVQRLLWLLALMLSSSVLSVSTAPGQTRVAQKTLRMPASADSGLPPTLADTGAFADLRTLRPSAGILPFQINVPLWADGAHKTRWFSLSETNLTIGFNREGKWSFPSGTTWIKLFELDLTNGVPSSARRLETRFLVRTTEGVYGVTYRWDDSQTNATLVPAEGLDEKFTVHEGGTVRTQTWHYPSRWECLRCHNPVAGYALGFNTAQLNCDVDYGDGARNQIRALSDAGFFASPVTNLHTLPALTAATNTAVSVEHRVRSYLAANCVHCHQPGAECGQYGLQRSFDAQPSTPLRVANLVNGLPVFGNFGESENRIIKPDGPTQSIMLRRVADLTPGIHMPPLATSVLNTQAVQLLTEWITNELSGFQSYADWQMNEFGQNFSNDAASAADPDHDGAPNYLEYLTGTNPHAAAGAWRISLRRTTRGMEVHFPRLARMGFEVEWTGDIANPASWQPLDVPGNRPFFAATPQEAVVEDAEVSAIPRFYRVRVYEP
jgi:uncharacterized repeat protein (TIGR03806 family)